MNVSLSSTFEAYIQKQLDEGTYNNASEVAREALRLKMQQNEIYQTRLKSLRAAIIQGAVISLVQRSHYILNGAK